VAYTQYTNAASYHLHAFVLMSLGRLTHYKLPKSTITQNNSIIRTRMTNMVMNSLLQVTAKWTDKTVLAVVT